MTLKQDDRALLQLICERGQTYADLAGLLGLTEDEVRTKARGALEELGGADPDAEVGLTDYLLGQADPIGRADAIRYLQQDPDGRDLAADIATKLQVIAPKATLPSLPEPKGRRRKPAPPPTGDAATTAEPTADSAAARTPSTDAAAGAGGIRSRQSALIAALGAGGVILVVVILIVAGVFSSDDGDSPSPDAAAAEAQREITPVELSAQNGSGVAGRADFGLANDQLYIDLTVDGLNPDLGKGSVYVIWLMLNDKNGYPVSVVTPNDNGSVQERYAVPTAVAVAIGSNARSVRISESARKDLGKSITKAVDQGQPVVPFTGDPVASGDIPLAEGGGQGGGSDSP